MTRQSHSSIKIHSVHPPTFHQVNPDKGYRRSHIGPPPQPDKPAASLGDYCSAVLSTDWHRVCHDLRRHELPLRALRRLASPISRRFRMLHSKAPTVVAVARNPIRSLRSPSCAWRICCPGIQKSQCAWRARASFRTRLRSRSRYSLQDAMELPLKGASKRSPRLHT